MNNKLECPHCIGVGEEIVVVNEKEFYNKICHLCDGEGIVDEDVSNTYISDLITFYNDDDNIV